MPCDYCVYFDEYDHDECESYYCDCSVCKIKDIIVNGGEQMENQQLNLADYGTGNSVNMKVLDDKASFTIVGVERSDYEENLGIKFETRESFDGNNRFHTTRVAIVSKFYSQEGQPTALTTAILAGGELKVKVEKTKFKNGKEGFVLAQA